MSKRTKKSAKSPVKAEPEAPVLPPDPWWQVSFWSSSINEGADLMGAALVQADCFERAIHAARSGADGLRWCAARASELPERVVRLLAAEYQCRLLTADEAFWLTRYVTAKLTRFRARAAGEQVEPDEKEPTLPDGHAELATLRTQLEPHEESPVRWYWSDGATLSERSTTGAMLENHAIYSEEAIEFENGLRSGKIKLEKGETFERFGWPLIEYGLAGREAVYESVYDDEGRFKGERFTGEYEDTRVPVTNDAGGELGYSEHQETVEITAEYITPAGHEQNGEAIMKKADISHVMRAMMVLPHHDGIAAFEVLRVYLGPEGERWNLLRLSGESAYSHGRIASLYLSTRAGRRLLRWEDELRVASGQEVSDDHLQKRMESLVQFAAKPGDNEWKKPAIGRFANMKESEARRIVRQLLVLARAEADIMYWRAVHAWREALRLHGAKVLKKKDRDRLAQRSA